MTAFKRFPWPYISVSVALMHLPIANHRIKFTAGAFCRSQRRGLCKGVPKRAELQQAVDKLGTLVSFYC